MNDNIGQEWYELWMQQSKQFLKLAEENLKNFSDVSKQQKELENFMETLKKQFAQNKHVEYWQSMSKMCMEAAEMMMKECMRREKENKPIKNVNELYELWMSCCKDIYQKTMMTEAYQKMYGDFVNKAFSAWKDK